MPVTPSTPTLVLAEFFLPQVGGSINWMVNTYGRYPKGEVVFFAQECEGDTILDPTLPFPVQRFPFNFVSCDPTVPSAWSKLFSFLRKVWNVCGEYGIQQIHCAKVLPEGLIARGIRSLNSIPYVIYAHGEEIKFCQTSRILRWIMVRVYNDASVIIANSANTKRLLEEVGVRSSHIHIIHPGVNAEDFEVKDGQGLGIRQRYKLESPVLVTVGRLQRRKGQDMVIRSLPNVRRVFPMVKYLIVGDGEEKAYLQNLAYECGVADSVIFAGSVPDAELAAHYAAGDVFIMANRQIGEDIEGFGMVYLEAGALGKPVIGGTSGGTGDAIVDGVTGLRVDGTNLDDIATAIITLFSDGECAARMGQNGQRRVKEEFSWDLVYHKTRTVVANLS